MEGAGTERSSGEDGDEIGCRNPASAFKAFLSWACVATDFCDDFATFGLAGILVLCVLDGLEDFAVFFEELGLAITAGFFVGASEFFRVAFFGSGRVALDGAFAGALF